ncbi:MAG: hypothetical protein P4L34_12205 [Paludibacter sp.]|nr:hypothetical protein [Paludibacter sp.]
MKKLKLLAFALMLMLAGSAQSQLSVRLNIGTPPAWGPAGYNDVHYYYLPDIESYYDVQSSMFIYYSGNRWIHSRNLPGRYRNYDLYGGYKVPMNGYRGNTPYTHFREYRMKYARGYRGNPQRNVGERNNRQEKHNEFQQNRDNRGNNDRQMRNNNHDHGNNKGQGRGNDKKDGHDNGNRN